MPTKKKLTSLDTALLESIDKVLAPSIAARGTRNLVLAHISLAVQAFLYGPVVDAKIVMFDKTPMMRIIVRYDGKYHTVDKTHPFTTLMRFYVSGFESNIEQWSKAILSILPQDLVAMKMADIENASSTALQDPVKTGPIHRRLAAKRAADKERLTAKIREVFRGHDNLISEDEILAMWRETMCAEVMDS